MQVLKIVYEEESFLVVHKPSGLLVHRTQLATRETESVVTCLEAMDISASPCHRLDRATSGVLLLAKNKVALRELNQQFADNTVEKFYLAIVRGWIAESGEIDYPLMEEEGPHKGKVKEALTAYRSLEQFELPYSVGRYPTGRFSLIELKPRTGRRHQIRRHLAHLRHPILGDTTHGDGKQNVFIRNTFNCHRLCLAATHLRFSHPETHEPHEIKCNLESSFARLVEEMRSQSNTKSNKK